MAHNRLGLLSDAVFGMEHQDTTDSTTTKQGYT